MKKFKEIKKEDVKKFIKDNKDYIWLGVCSAGLIYGIGTIYLNVRNKQYKEPVVNGLTMAVVKDRGELMNNFQNMIDKHYSSKGMSDDCETLIMLLSDI